MEFDKGFYILCSLHLRITTWHRYKLKYENSAEFWSRSKTKKHTSKRLRRGRLFLLFASFVQFQIFCPRLSVWEEGFPNAKQAQIQIPMQYKELSNTKQVQIQIPLKYKELLNIKTSSNTNTNTKSLQKLLPTQKESFNQKAWVSAKSQHFIRRDNS